MDFLVALITFSIDFLIALITYSIDFLISLNTIAYLLIALNTIA